jgi:hypothetical protein
VGIGLALLVFLVLRLFGPHAPNRGFDWGNFASGTLNGEGIVDQTQNWNRDHVRILRGGGPNGGNAALVVANDSVQIPRFDLGGTPHVRVHGFRSTVDDPHTRWFGSTKPHQVAEAISIKLPTGYAYNNAATTTLELHGDNGTGPAPFNLDFTHGGTFQLIIRGSDSTDTSQGYAFEQTTFGASKTRHTSDGRRDRSLPFIGGNVVARTGDWVHFRFWWHDLTTDRAKGAFTAWINTGSGWRKVADASGVRTADADVNGDGQVVYPMLSLYYDEGHGGTQAVEYAAGRVEPTLDQLESWQHKRLGLN